jgi:ADP-ribose pyrophosphatase YjhB (NUDIX family)
VTDPAPEPARVSAAPADEQAVRRQRVAAYVLCRRGGTVLLTRLSPGTPRPGVWTLPGGGLEHGEHPRVGAHREAQEETGLEVVVGEVLDVGSTHFTGRSPAGRLEDFHGISVVFSATTEDTREPEVLDVGGTSDAAAWVPVADVEAGRVVVGDVVAMALDAAARTAPTA